MLNLDWVISQFVTQPPQWAPGEIESDHDVVRAVADKYHPQRRDTLRMWLERYSSLLMFSRDKRNETCEVILRFADELPRSEEPLSVDEVVIQFETLESLIQTIAPEDKNGLSPDVTSLTSKALWCCLPNDAPVFDRNARSALSTLARLMDMDPDCSGTEYSRFANLWLRIYERLASYTYFEDEASIRFYGFRVRFFDRFLWYLGNPDLCSTERTLASSADL